MVVPVGTHGVRGLSKKKMTSYNDIKTHFISGL